MRAWRLPVEEREQKQKEQKKQIEQDRQDFDRLFRVDIHRRGAGASSEFREYAEFINKRLRVSNWDKPIDGHGITGILRHAVRHGRLVPVIARNWHGGHRVFRHYAPQHWVSRYGSSHGGANAPAGRFTGPFAASMHVADTVMNSRLASSSRAFSSAEVSGGGSGFDWLGATESLAGAASGGATPNDDGDDSMLKSFGDTDDSGGDSLVSDAQSFDYLPNALGGDVAELAARRVSEAEEADLLRAVRNRHGNVFSRCCCVSKSGVLHRMQGACISTLSTMQRVLA
ncbi:conserved hypothetical protein [Burkholderia sp. 8Y]|uniref:hypothetical protein n=1 Tax=Burkholderia sp. 8Y TaxID=2653133 RepID=UPI0012F30799|nr:hypothetical protein [Burkholderia sp. 8Y]VXB66968.1 conserved hypothetical protein [Burkholderia sp. 8Y]